jgi:hypothetical protein
LAVSALAFQTSPAVVRAKADVSKMIGFEVILDDTVTPVMV